MVDTNYDSKWWGYIYDQMMAELSDWVDNNLRFYQSNLKNVRGQVLECACGTGIFLLPLLQDGYNIYGFDISRAMLITLRQKAAVLGIAEIESRISVQDFEIFYYDQRFEAILIPTNAFAHLTTQAAQVRTLKNIYNHLVPGGRLLLDIRLAGMRRLVDTPEVEEGNWYTWTHPDTGLPIRQRIVGRIDYDRQLILDQCYIEYEGQAVDFPMTSRWVFRDEFQLLLGLAGFARWEAFSTPERDHLVVGLDETYSYWIAEK
jgi:SAM-dependent methyltransferase